MTVWSGLLLRSSAWRLNLAQCRRNVFHVGHLRNFSQSESGRVRGPAAIARARTSVAIATATNRPNLRMDMGNHIPMSDYQRSLIKTRPKASTRWRKAHEIVVHRSPTTPSKFRSPQVQVQGGIEPLHRRPSAATSTLTANGVAINGSSSFTRFSVFAHEPSSRWARRNSSRTSLPVFIFSA